MYYPCLAKMLFVFKSSKLGVCLCIFTTAGFDQHQPNFLQQTSTQQPYFSIRRTDNFACLYPNKNTFRLINKSYT